MKNENARPEPRRLIALGVAVVLAGCAVTPEPLTGIRSSFCNQVHYFTSPADAAGWLDRHPGAEVVSVAKAHRIGATLTTSFLDRLQHGPDAGGGECHCC